MKILFYMGRNPSNKSGLSWKIWKVERKGRTVTTWWGRAIVRKRKVVPAANLQSKTFRFTSAAAALEYEKKRIRSKLNKGYERRTRWRS